MTFAGSDLTSAHRQLLARLADENLHEGADDVEISRINPRLLAETAELVRSGLVERKDGLSGRVWLRLATVVRRVEDDGAR